MLRLLSELLFALRRNGLAISPPQAIDAAKAIAEIGWEDRSLVREALACILVTSLGDRARFEEGFDEFFDSASPHVRDFWGRLRHEGLSEAEIQALRDLLEAFASQGSEPELFALLGERNELERLLATSEIRRVLEPLTSPLQAGFYTHRVLDRTGLSRAGATVEKIREHLRESLGDERAEAIARALRREIERARFEVRAHVERTLRQRLEPEGEEASSRKLSTTPFVSLTQAELDEVRRAVREFAMRLKGAARVRERKAKRGRLDPRATLRKSLRTGGIPFQPARRDRRRDKPRLVVLCDVSDSVRVAARFMLELVYAVQELFDGTRSFVFVSDIGEVSELFRRERPHLALAAAYSGQVIDTSQSSSYGRAFQAFEARFPDAIDARTTVVILGDGRTNYRPHGGEVLDRMRARAKRVFWLCPDPKSAWGVGDSAMPVYAAKVSRVFEARSASDLERAARVLVQGG